MSLFALSLSHRTATMDTLAAATVGNEAATKLCHALVAGDHVHEVTVLSTCNRVEVYADVDRFHGGLDEVVTVLGQVTGLAVPRLQDSCGVYYDEGVVAHAFSVAAGLDSVVPGESQVLGQFRDALAVGQAAGTVGSALNALFQQGIRVGKRVRTETEVGRAGRSLVDAAHAALASELGSVAGRSALVVGAGQMAGAAARSLAADGARVTVANRTTATAERLVASLPGAAVQTWSDWQDALTRAEVLVSCTGSSELLVRPEDLQDTPVRAVVDLAMPPDVDPRVAELDAVRLVNLESLRDAAARDGDADGLAAARQLVADEVGVFLADRRARSVTPTVVALRSMADEVVAAELARLDARVPDLDDAVRDELGRTVRRVAHKLLHAPTVRVQEYAASDGVDYAAALRDLFALDPHSVAAVMSSEVGR